MNAKAIEDIAAIKRLKNWTALEMSSGQARHYADRLLEFGEQPTLETAYDLDGIISAFVMAYGRLFVSSGQSARLEAAIFEGTEHMAVHQELLSLRHTKYAHHGDHDFTKFSLSVEDKGNEYVITQRFSLVLPGTRFEKWSDTLNFARDHIGVKTVEFLEKAAEVAGKPMRFPNEVNEPISAPSIEIMTAK